MASEIVAALLAAALATLFQLGSVLGPMLACAVVLHQLERMLRTTLVDAFGWRAVLVTGWVGVPVHELSHLAACLVFTHEVEEVKLFAPDPETGTLGFVRHRAPRGNPWAEVGRFFIGVAPLFGGALTLYLVARTLWPQRALLAMATPGALDGPHAALGRAWLAASSLMDPAHLESARFWVFLYLVMAIGAHLAPSVSDLRGAVRGGLALVLGTFVVNLVAHPFGGLGTDWVVQTAAAMTPIVALLVLAVLLTAVVLAPALLVSAAFVRLRGGRGHLARFVRLHWARLVLGGVAGWAFLRAVG